MVRPVTSAKAFLAHDGDIPAIAGAARLRPEHVEVVSLVVALVEALRAERHAWTDAARATSVSN